MEISKVIHLVHLKAMPKDSYLGISRAYCLELEMATYLGTLRACLLLVIVMAIDLETLRGLSWGYSKAIQMV